MLLRRTRHPLLDTSRRLSGTSRRLSGTLCTRTTGFTDAARALLHLLADNAPRAGHLDIAHEVTDGAVRDVGADAVRAPSR
ncbi:MAG: hypothetical protein ACRCSN_15850 [Dermatophilaceae bacterium]